jgi:hypothetical protein
MNPKFIFFALMAIACPIFAGSLPVITTGPQNPVSSGNTVSFSVVSSNATAFQWRFNGADIAEATGSMLQVSNPQPGSIGYYMAVAKNASGWVPSGMAFLSVAAGSIVVPFSNVTNLCTNGQASGYSRGPLNNCTAQVVAGPALDEMQPAGSTATVSNGYYGFSLLTRMVPGISTGQGARK